VIAFRESVTEFFSLATLGCSSLLTFSTSSSATNRIIRAKDHASVQIVIPHVDKEGHLTNQSTTIALSGFVRAQGRGDAAINKIAQESGFVNAFPEYELAK
jgi:small subunit ribosomal protein S21e